MVPYNVSLDGNYVDRVSITYDTPSSHIWTYAAGYTESASTDTAAVCPCNTNVNMPNVPSHVGSDYYCGSGNTHTFAKSN